MFSVSNRKETRSYIGQWLADARSGQGTAFYSKKDNSACISYTGQWRLNKRDGEGEAKYRDGSVYSGSWSQNEAAGYGHLRKPNGDVYEGYWVGGKREGAGSYFYVQTGKVFVGEWGDDMPLSGVFEQALKNKSEAGILPVTSTLPEVELEDAKKVVGDGLEEVNNDLLVIRNSAQRE